MTGRSLFEGHGPSGGHSATGALGEKPEWANGLTSPRSR